MLEDDVVVLALVEGERVLEAGAAAAANGDAESLLVGVLVSASSSLSFAAAMSVSLIAARVFPWLQILSRSIGVTFWSA